MIISVFTNLRLALLRLLYCQLCLLIVVIVLCCREQRTFIHFLRTTLNSIKDLRGLGLDRINTTENNDGKDKLSVMLVEEEVMQQRLIYYFTEKQKRTKRKNG